jgi:glycosyltransferase involved in cell wall biosynthesis
VALQTWLPAEVIIVSDGNPAEAVALLEDAVRRVVQSSSLNIRFVILSENRGPGAARNRGWEQASEEYVAFLDADDMWHPEKVERQVGWMTTHPSVAFTAHAYVPCLKGGTFLPRSFSEPKALSPYSLLWRNFIATPTVVLRRCLSFRFPEKRYAEDYALWLRIALSGFTPYYFKEGLAFGLKPPWGWAGLSANLWKMELGELDTYMLLAREKMIPWAAFPILAAWSLAKFSRRYLLSWVQRKWRSGSCFY